MPLLDIELVKKHLRVDWSDDDVAIAAYQAAAETMVSEYIDREIYIDGDSPAPTDALAIELNGPITAAMLLLIGNMYESREGGNEQGALLPRPVRALLAPYRVWRVQSEGVCD